MQMAFMSFQLRPLRVQQFHSAVIASLMSVSSSMVLSTVVWRHPELRIWGLAFIGMMLALTYIQLWRIHNVYDVAYQKAVDGDQTLRKALNEMVRTYLWGNTAYMLCALAILQVSVSRR